jgi:predicted metal-dependent hydrolase
MSKKDNKNILYQSNWYRGNPVVTNIFNSYMVLIPEAELFFIKTVMLFIKDIDNLELKNKLRLLIKQEQNHRIKHIVFAQELESEGFETTRLLKFYKYLFFYFRRFISKRFNLAICLGLEYSATCISHLWVNRILSAPEESGLSVIVPDWKFEYMVAIKLPLLDCYCENT